jgi:hypothetical protein
MSETAYSKKIDRKKIDAEFRRRWMSVRCAADRESLAGYVRDNYFSLLYYFAGNLLSALAGTARYEDEVSSLVIDVMEEIVTAIRDGRNTYSGKSAFSSYLYSALRLKHLEKSKIYYPSQVEREGMAAKHAYRLLLVERFDAAQVEYILGQRYELSPERTREILALVRSYEHDETVRRRYRGEFSEDDSFERLREENPYGLPSSGETALSDYIKESEIKLLYEAISSLEEPAASVIRGYVLEGRWQNLKEMEEELGVKNGSYELKKAKQRLRKLMD